MRGARAGHRGCRGLGQGLELDLRIERVEDEGLGLHERLLDGRLGNGRKVVQLEAELLDLEGRFESDLLLVELDHELFQRVEIELQLLDGGSGGGLLPSGDRGLGLPHGGHEVVAEVDLELVRPQGDSLADGMTRCRLKRGNDTNELVAVDIGDHRAELDVDAHLLQPRLGFPAEFLAHRGKHRVGALQQDHPRLGQLGTYLATGLDTGAIGQANVHHHQVGLERQPGAFAALTKVETRLLSEEHRKVLQPVDIGAPPLLTL
mgnify:CR=1 FL=1